VSHLPTSGKLWGIVLAGGEGTRVRTLLQHLCGGRGIKQFCAVIGRRSMLEHTLARVERVIPRARIVVVLSADHRPEAAPQLAHWPADNILYQPANRDTAPGILLPPLEIRGLLESRAQHRGGHPFTVLLPSGILVILRFFWTLT
jgi:mannose-1-phosphate guanylyltransferase